jgi:hypothetical protein
MVIKERPSQRVQVTGQCKMDQGDLESRAGDSGSRFEEGHIEVPGNREGLRDPRARRLLQGHRPGEGKQYPSK